MKVTIFINNPDTIKALNGKSIESFSDSNIKIIGNKIPLLGLTKLIKDHSGLSLLESRDIVLDILNLEKVDIEVKNVESFRSEISDFDKENLIKIRYFNKTLSREISILELGICEEKDYIDFIIEHYSDIENPEFKDIFKDILIKIDKNKLSEIFNKFKDILQPPLK